LNIAARLQDHSPSMKQPAVVPSVWPQGSQPAAPPDRLWYCLSSDNDLALLARINYTHRTVANALTYSKVSRPQEPRFFLWQKHGVCCKFFLEQLAYSGAPTPQQVSTTIWSLQSSSVRMLFVTGRQQVGRV